MVKLLGLGPPSIELCFIHSRWKHAESRLNHIVVIRLSPPRAYAKSSYSILIPLFRLVLSGNHQLGIVTFKAAGFFKVHAFSMHFQIIFQFFEGNCCNCLFGVFRAEILRRRKS
jgi:hypothetical protein